MGSEMCIRDRPLPAGTPFVRVEVIGPVGKIIKGVLPTYVFIGVSKPLQQKNMSPTFARPLGGRGEGCASQNKSNLIHFNHKTFTLGTHARLKTANLGGGILRKIEILYFVQVKRLNVCGSVQVGTHHINGCISRGHHREGCDACCHE